jgi:peptide/nickel transport system permease protein
MSEANQTINTSSVSDPAAAIRQLQLGVSAKPRTLLGDAWRRFRKHTLAMIGAGILIFLTLAVTVGAWWYERYLVDQLAQSGMPVTAENPDIRVLIDHLDFLALLSPPTACASVWHR